MKIYIKSSKYSYQGSVADKFGNIRIRDSYFETIANSEAEAKRNILSQAKRRLGLKNSAYLKLVSPEKIDECVDNAVETYSGQDRIYCPNCGMRLTDGGFCPNCYSEGDETNYS